MLGIFRRIGGDVRCAPRGPRGPWREICPANSPKKTSEIERTASSGTRHRGQRLRDSGRSPSDARGKATVEHMTLTPMNSKAICDETQT